MTRLFAAVAASMLLIAQARAEIPGGVLKVGVLTDMAGPYADLSGKGSVVAAQMAAEDFAAEAGPRAPWVEIVTADHLNKADVGAGIVRRWLDEDGIAAVIDVPNSTVALAINQILRDKDRAFIASSVASSDLTGKFCMPTTVQWTMDTWALANGTAKTMVNQHGDTWFFLTADYAFGHALARDASALVVANGGKVLGEVRHPLGTADFSSPLLTAQSSGAKVIALANAGSDAGNAIKQAAEFGIGSDGRQQLAGLLIFITDVDALGLQAAQRMVLTSAFYWDLNDQTRAWSRRFAARMNGRMPTMDQAGVYSSMLAYLRAAAAADTISGAKIVARMASAPVDDSLFGTTIIRRDGRAVHDMYLFQVKAPAESKGRWDYYKLLATIPAQQAFRPAAEGGCLFMQ